MNICDILLVIKQVILTFLTLFSMMLPTSFNNAVAYNAENSDELIMSFSVVSDIHIETNKPENYLEFNKLLQSIKAGRDHDAVVYLGDNVMNGQFFENFLFYSGVKAIMPAENNFVLMGNHDIGNRRGNYDKFCADFINFNSLYLENNIEKPYYYKIVNGCYMIFLASEDLTVNTFTMSDEQFSWLENILNEADESDSPIFVFNHHPIHQLDGIEWYSLIDLLSTYDNLLYLNGHTHMELSEYSFRTQGGVNTIYLPRSTDVTSYKTGNGVVVEVYEDEIIVRCRNFIDGEWIEDLEYRYPLV